MINVAEDTVLVGATELRTEVPRLMKIKKKIIVMKRGKPIGVIQDYDEYNEKEEAFEAFEDLVLGYIAKERLMNSSDNDFVDSKTAKKMLGIK